MKQEEIDKEIQVSQVKELAKFEYSIYQGEQGYLAVSIIIKTKHIEVAPDTNKGSNK